MNKLILRPLFTMIISCLFIITNAQSIFKKGYIVNNNGVKITCLIKDLDWRSNPVEIRSQLNESNKILTATIDSIQEFGFSDNLRYVRETVKIDSSSRDIAALSSTKQPIWTTKTLFLKELIHGSACLWSYCDNNDKWFFYSNSESKVPVQLIFKEFITEGKIDINEGFKQQLNINVNNEYTENINFMSLNYSERDFIKYFNTYNHIVIKSEKREEKKVIREEKEVINFKPFISADLASLLVGKNESNISPEYHFKNKMNWSAGVETEYFLPFNNNKVSLLSSIFFEKTKFKNTTYIKATNRVTSYELNTSTINFPIGARYNVYPNTYSRIFLNIYFNSMINIHPSKNNFISTYYGGWNIKYTEHDLKLSEGNNLILGAGYIYKKIGVEFKYQLNRYLLNSHMYWYSDYTKASLAISYKLFTIKK